MELAIQNGSLWQNRPYPDVRFIDLRHELKDRIGYPENRGGDGPFFTIQKLVSTSDDHKEGSERSCHRTVIPHKAAVEVKALKLQELFSEAWTGQSSTMETFEGSIWMFPSIITYHRNDTEDAWNSHFSALTKSALTVAAELQKI